MTRPFLLESIPENHFAAIFTWGIRIATPITRPCDNLVFSHSAESERYLESGIQMCFADPDPAILHSTLFVNAFVREKIALVAIAGIPGFRFSVKIHEDEIGVAPEPGRKATVVPPADLSPCPRGVPIEEDGAIHVTETVAVVAV